LRVNALAVNPMTVQRFPLSFLMRVNQAFLDAVDEWRRGQPDLPGRAEAVRRLVEQALEKSEPPDDR
jgi:hypothetical protein